jgi:predicted nucleotidyltransferase
MQGYGCEWEVLLFGGPADGCTDLAVSINKEIPPKIIKKIIDGKEIERETLSEKIIEYLAKDYIDGNQRVAVYTFRKITKNNKCFYDYLETIKMSQFRIKYGDLQYG